ncbi:MAG: hypothetical protein RLZZ42_1381 [Bacteroidota bacterium]
MLKSNLFFIFCFLLMNAAARNGLDTLGKNSLLFSGTEYFKQFNEVKGNPFFPTSNNWGQVNYHGYIYNNIEVLYDCEDDIALVRDQQGLLKLKLIREKLDGFTIDKHKFIKLKLLSSGGEYYEELYRNKYALLMQWQKKAELDSQEIERYILKKTLFMLKGSAILPITSRSELQTLVPEKEKELKKIYRSNRLNFKKDPIEASRVIIREIENKGW